MASFTRRTNSFLNVVTLLVATLHGLLGVRTLKDVSVPSLPLMTTAKQDCEVLMNAVLPFGKQMLSRRRELFPFGGTMSLAGEVAQVAGWTGNERPPSRQVIALLNGGFRDGAALGKYRATALVYDIRVVPPGSTEKQDAIAVNLDHRDVYSVVVVFPYTFSETGALKLGSPFARAGAAVIFHQ